MFKMELEEFSSIQALLNCMRRSPTGGSLCESLFGGVSTTPAMGSELAPATSATMLKETLNMAGEHTLAEQKDHTMMHTDTP